MKHLILLTVLLSVSHFSMGFEDGFYSASSNNCSNDFIELVSSDGKYRTFSKTKDSFSLTFDKFTINRSGLLSLNMGSYKFLAEYNESGKYPMYLLYEGKKKKHAQSLYKCKPLNEDVLTMYKDLVKFSEKYPETNFGVGYSKEFSVRP